MRTNAPAHTQKYLILLAFQRQQQLRERASMLHVHRLSCYNYWYVCYVAMISERNVIITIAADLRSDNFKIIIFAQNWPSRGDIQGGSNMTGTNCDLYTYKQSRSYLNHPVLVTIWESHIFIRPFHDHQKRNVDSKQVMNVPGPFMSKLKFPLNVGPIM